MHVLSEHIFGLSKVSLLQQFVSFVLCNNGKDHLWIKGGKSVENAIAVLANEGLHLDGEQPIDLDGLSNSSPMNFVS